MNAKKYLSRARFLKSQIKRTEERIETLRIQMQSVGAIRYDKDRVQSSAGDPMIEYIEKLEDLQVREQELRIEYNYAYSQIRERIDGLEDPLFASVLSCRYLDEMQFWEIADKLGYSVRYMENVHGRALQAFAKMYDES